MFINNMVWVAFWVLFFTRFPVLRGWTVQDVITVWALAGTGFGWATALVGNAQSLPTLIAQGQLDVWMLYPRALLPHLILGRMSATAWGDVLFGYIVYIFFVQPDWAHFLLFLALTFSVGLLFLGFFIATGSLSFYLGNAKGIAEQWHFAMIVFSTYPAILFDGRVKLLLYTLIPAAFVTELPIEALRQLSLYHAGLALLGSLAVLLIGILIFYHGLRAILANTPLRIGQSHANARLEWAIAGNFGRLREVFIHDEALHLYLTTVIDRPCCALDCRKCRNVWLGNNQYVICDRTSTARDR